MSIQDDVDRLIDERPGRELLNPDYDEKALPLNDFIFRSAGTSASYMIVSGGERVIVNTGMGWESPHHKHLFDAIHAGPTPYIVTTQGHVDHVGGVSLFREPDTRYVAQEKNPTCQADDGRLPRFRGATAMTWFPHLLARIQEFGARYPGVLKGQDVPAPDLVFEEQIALHIESASRAVLISDPIPRRASEIRDWRHAKSRQPIQKGTRWQIEIVKTRKTTK